MVGLNDDGRHLTARTVGSLGDHLCDFHEIFVPTGTGIYGVFLFHAAYFSIFQAFLA